MKVTIKFAKVRPEAIIPSKRDEDAGFDIYPCFDEFECVIKAHQTKLIPTGIAAAVDSGYYLQVEERGSTGSIGMKKSAGVIDSGYRGEIFIAITNTRDQDLIISKELNEVKEYNGFIYYPSRKAIAQLILHEVIPASIQTITYDELKAIPSQRGDGHLGSSGK